MCVIRNNGQEACDGRADGQKEEKGPSLANGVFDVGPISQVPKGIQLVTKSRLDFEVSLPCLNFLQTSPAWAHCCTGSDL